MKMSGDAAKRNKEAKQFGENPNEYLLQTGQNYNFVGAQIDRTTG